MDSKEKELIEKVFNDLIDLVKSDFDLIDKTCVKHLHNQLKLTRATLLAQLKNGQDAIQLHEYYEMYNDPKFREELEYIFDHPPTQ